MHPERQCLFYGPIITPQSRLSSKFLHNALLYVEHGTIKWIEEEIADDSHLEDVIRSRGLQDIKVRKIKRGEFLMPGFIDTHTHAPQFPIIGSGGQSQLLDWLNNYVFPAESKFGDKSYSEKVYASVVRRTLDGGTTTCCYFGTTHLVGDKVLADVVKASGQRGFIGKCNMDRNAPDKLLDSSPEESVETTRALIAYIDSLDSSLVRPIVTPRFAISCTDKLLKALGHLVVEQSELLNRHHYHADRLPVQTHISENLDEVKTTSSLFPQFPNYASVYDGFGLLGPTTILAHGCHLSREEIALIKQRGAGISHCPTSNFNLTSGVARVGEWLDEDVKVGLGTDVSGGFSTSMIVAIRHASIASKTVAMRANNALLEEPKPLAPRASNPTSNPTSSSSPQTSFAAKPLPIATLLYLATLGGAELCNLEQHTGSLAPGKVFDALLVSLRPERGNPNVWWSETDEDGGGKDSVDGQAYLQASLEKLFFCGDDRNISAVWVEGKLVGGQEYHRVDC